MGVGQLSESDAVDALRLPFYSSSHPTGSHGWRNQFDLGNPDLDDFGVLTGTPILTFPVRGGRDLSSPHLRERVRGGVIRIYHIQLEAVLAIAPACRSRVELSAQAIYGWALRPPST